VQPSGIAQMIQGFVLFAVISSDVLLRYKVRLVRPRSGQSTAGEAA
jgi:hypothetical protein